MAVLPAAKGIRHAFKRPPLDLPTLGPNGSSPSNAYKIRSLLDLVDYSAFHNPDLLFCLQESKDSLNPRRITYRALAEAVARCTGWLAYQNLQIRPRQSRASSEAKHAPVALLMSSDITLFIYVLALMRLGVPVALFSARLSPSAIAHLVEKTGASSIIITAQTSRSAKEAVDLAENGNRKTVPYIQSVSYESFIEGKHPMYDQVPPILPIVDELDRNAVILHSSGSTGLPKPIYHTHGYLLNYAKCHAFTEEDDTSRVCTSTLPLFHGFGMLAPALALSIGKPFALPSASTVPNAESTIRLLQASNSTSLMTVPLILEDICHTPHEVGVKALQPLDFVACGGGPMKSSVAEILSSKGVRLLNHCGATEIGALAPIFNPQPDYDWHYFVIREDINLRLEDVVEKPGCVKLVGRAPGWDEDFVVQDFLRPNPQAPKTQFQFLGRADDLIVLANGEKIRCTSLEARVADDPRVTDAIAFGDGRNHLGLIIEAAPDVRLDCSNTKEVEHFLQSIWPTVDSGNKHTDSHGAVSKEMIIVTSSSHRPLKRTAKGSLARKEIFDSFEKEIDAIYAKVETANVNPLPDLDDTSALEEYLRQALTDILGLSRQAAPLGVEDDIFEMGMNSLQATRLLNTLKIALEKKRDTEAVSSTLSKGFVYMHPTLASQCKALAAFALDRDESDEPSRTALMLKAVEEHCKSIAAMSPEGQPFKSSENTEAEGRIVVVTGSTGNLGSSLVHALVQDSGVSRVYCLNRPSSSQLDGFNRQYQAFNKAGIALPKHLWSKITPVVVKPQEPDLGVDPNLYRQLQGASHIIHNAWPMDFNRSLVSFETQFQYLDNVIRLALRSTSTAPLRVLFTSSIASVARYPSITQEALVPEMPMDDPEVTAPFGYPEAKWVCEQILLRSAQLHETRLEPIVVRVGQLTGSTTAASWSSTEHIPSIFRSSQHLGALPDIGGTLSWLPLDLAATSLLEILFQSTPNPSSPIYHLENPVRQSWPAMTSCLSRLLSPSPASTPLPLLPLPEWLARVRSDSDLDANPAGRLLDFLEESFAQLGTGKLVLDTKRASEVSGVLKGMTAVDEKLVGRYVAFWRAQGVLG